MNTPLDTPLHRVEQLLQRSEAGLTIQRITQGAGVTEKEAKASIKALHCLGQIETIPTPGRWGNRYAWLAAKSVTDTAVDNGIGTPLPDAAQEPRLSPEAKPVTTEPPAIPDEDLIAGVRAAMPAVAVPAGAPELEPPVPGPYLLLVPKRPMRIVNKRERAEALAMAAVRRGAAWAEVMALTPVGKARRGATWDEAR